MSVKALEKFEWAVNFLIVRRHFVHQILGMMKKIPKPGMGTMGVRVTNEGRFQLFYDPDWVTTLKDEHMTYIFYHEVLHLALHHCTLRKFDDHQLGNIAYDLAVNELIPEDQGCAIPRDKNGNIIGCIVSEFKKNPIYKDIEPKQTAEWYYDFLKKRMPRVEIEIQGAGDGDPKDGKGGGSGKDEKDPKDGKGGGNGKDEKDPKDGKGKSQGGGGKDEKDKPEDGSGNGNKKVKIKVRMLDDHGEWKEHEIADERVRAKIQEIDKTEMWGDMPGGSKEAILSAQTKRINWRAFLRMFPGTILWPQKDSTRKRPNRRTGYIHPGSKRQHVDRMLVAIDTSGSIDSELLAQFLDTINKMTDQFPIDMCVFDTEIQQGPMLWSRKKKNFDFAGRGGTCFECVMQLSIERRYKGVIILTDGCASPPTKPPRTKVLWALCEGAKAPVDWGIEVHLKKY